MAHSISLERLREIKANIWASHGWDKGCTAEERKQINQEWNSMPGSYSFFDAVATLVKRAEKG